MHSNFISKDTLQKVKEKVKDLQEKERIENEGADNNTGDSGGEYSPDGTLLEDENKSPMWVKVAIGVGVLAAIGGYCLFC